MPLNSPPFLILMVRHPVLKQPSQLAVMQLSPITPARFTTGNEVRFEFTAGSEVRFKVRRLEAWYKILKCT